ncbi:MAG TPA: hypothetical protein VM009_00260 [Terriglobales bacterium]|nr:hypothetical protein [Terriglobales bacterium]
MPFSRKQAIFAATLATAVVGITFLLLRGWNPVGLASSARNTARFSGILFALALLARSTRWPSLFARRWELFFAFVAAHGVHFGAVIMVAAFDTTHKLHQLEAMPIMTLMGGFSLLVFAAVTAGTAEVPFTSRMHGVFFYLLGVIFLVGFGTRAMHSRASAAMLVVVLLAFIVRFLPSRESATASASA